MARPLRQRARSVRAHRRPPRRRLRSIALLIDTGPIYAAANNRGRHHQACLDLLRSATPPFVVPSLVVAEVSYLVGEILGPAAETDFFRMLCSDRFRIEPVTEAISRASSS